MFRYLFSIHNLLIGVGKTSLVHLIIKGSSITHPTQTIGCTVGVKVRFNILLILQGNFKIVLKFNFAPSNCCFFYPAHYLWIFRELFK